MTKMEVGRGGKKSGLDVECFAYGELIVAFD